tara:strand:- start:13586 stop:14734 length:1149 start_codon:yes stop_codon:yes gene_type:complete
MNIALVSHLFPNELATSQGKFIKDLFELLKKNNSTEVSLLVPTPYAIPFTKRNSLNNAPFICGSKNITRLKFLSFPRKTFPRVIQKSISYTLLSHLEGLPPDIVHVHWLYPDGLAIPALKKAGYKVILTIHGSDWYQSINKPHFRPIISEIFDCVDRVLYSGPQLKIDVENVFPKLSAKSDVIYNMVDSQKYTPISTTEKVEKRTKLGWDDSKIHALTVASIREEKGIDLLLDAIIDNSELKDTIFHIIGNYENTAYSNKIKNKLDQGHFQNIQVHPTVSPDQLIEYLHATDVYISPSRREAFGLALTEASFCGVPFLSSPTGISSKLAELGYGKIVSEFSRTNLVSHIPSIVAMKPNTTAIKKLFSSDAYLKKLFAIYSGI